MFWEQLPTPAALVDRDRVESNTRRMSERVARLGARLRPHVKTHKCVEAARLSVRDHFGGITVSTLAEARHFSRAGFRNVTYAVPISPGRLEEAAELSRGLEELNLLLDNAETLSAMEACAKAKGTKLRSFLKVDCGYHRAGVDPEKSESVALALRLARSPQVEFRGILTHGGHSYHCAGPEEIGRVARQERDVVVGFAEKLRAAGAAPPDVSLGSTPTLSVAESLDGVTEARPGNYTFFDRFQATIGSCSMSDVAFSVLVSVIGCYPERNELLIDAGALAFSRDEGPRHVDPECGYGAVFTADGKSHLTGLRVASVSQEHGKIEAKPGTDLSRFPIGTRLRVVPNHSCLAAALFERYHVHRRGELVDEWKPVRGW